MAGREAVPLSPPPGSQSGALTWPEDAGICGRQTALYQPALPRSCGKAKRLLAAETPLPPKKEDKCVPVGGMLYSPHQLVVLGQAL